MNLIIEHGTPNDEGARTNCVGIILEPTYRTGSPTNNPNLTSLRTVNAVYGTGRDLSIRLMSQAIN